MIGVLSLATDFAIGQPLGYGLRSAVASVALARAMGLSEQVATEAYYHGLLRYCGCTAETDKLNALFGDEIAIRKNFSTIDPADGPEFVRVLMAHVGPARAEHPPLAHGDENFMSRPSSCCALPAPSGSPDRLFCRSACVPTGANLSILPPMPQAGLDRRQGRPAPTLRKLSVFPGISRCPPVFCPDASRGLTG